MAEKELSRLNLILGLREWEEIEKMSYEKVTQQEAMIICLKRIEITLDAILHYVEAAAKEKK